MRIWPPIVWVLVSVGSLLLLVGYNGADKSPPALVAGALLILGALVLAFYLAFGRWGDRKARGLSWLIPATAVFYALCAVAAMFAGGAYAVAAIAAGVIPLTAVTLLTATAKAKAADLGDDRSHTDPFPGIGVDDETPLGDTSEHSDAERVAEPDRRFSRSRRVRPRP